MADGDRPRKGPAQSKESLIWVLIVCGVVVVLAPIVAAVAIPRIQAWKRAGQERQLKSHAAIAGAANLRAYAVAQTMYYRTDWNDDGRREYAHPLTNLFYDPAVGNKAQGLIDKSLNDAAGAAGVPKQGYLFREPKTIGGQSIDWTKDFALCAIPAAPGYTVTFIIATDGIPYGKDLGAGATFLDDFPVDPKAEGWIEAP